MTTAHTYANIIRQKKAGARKRHLTGKEADAYTYGSGSRQFKKNPSMRGGHVKRARKRRYQRAKAKRRG